MISNGCLIIFYATNCEFMFVVLAFSFLSFLCTFLHFSEFFFLSPVRSSSVFVLWTNTDSYSEPRHSVSIDVWTVSSAGDLCFDHWSLDRLRLWTMHVDLVGLGTHSLHYNDGLRRLHDSRNASTHEFWRQRCNFIDEKGGLFVSFHGVNYFCLFYLVIKV